MLNFLKSAARRLDVDVNGNEDGALVAISAVVLDDDRFMTCSGSGSPEHHHYGMGGLLEHTHEVWLLILATVKALDLDVNLKELFLSAIFHDAGKMWDYECVNGVWQKSKHQYTIHHIPRSAIVWTNAVANTPQAL